MPCEALPVELEQHILSYLKDDIPSLRSCALTCHRWVYSTQRYLFAKVQLDFRHVPFPSQANPPDRFCQLLLSSPRISAYVRELSIVIAHGMEDQDLHRLTEILQVCLPLLRHLRGINLGRGSTTSGSSGGGGGRLNSVISSTTTSVTTAIPCPTTSSVSEPGIRPKGYIWPVSWSFIPSAVRNELRTAFRSQSLVHIRLAHMRGIPLSVLALAGCPLLEGLVLEDVTFSGALEGGGTGGETVDWDASAAAQAQRRPRDSVLQSQRRPLKMLRLELAEPAFHAFAQWATNDDCPLDISSVQHMSLTMPKQYSTHGGINALLSECADSLRTFCCRLEVQAIGVNHDAVTSPLDVSALHNLRTLRLAMCRPRQKKTGAAMILFNNFKNFIPNVLAQLEPATHGLLDEVSVKLDVGEWKTATDIREAAQRIRVHMLDRRDRDDDDDDERRESGTTAKFANLRKMKWFVAGNEALRAALADGLQATPLPSGCQYAADSEEGSERVVEVRPCDTADSPGYLDCAEEEEDTFATFAIF
ncbi:hypothetical protein JR316_0009710 [Psilocybe cubensis]|uniref:F-box domain-containing protein n=2 Tax=Psilocybe cubensis TaxID=181762 RepID=A0A8H7XQ55_PSICU|nr:hypothetical protein JR316_0009710 [Psilocybe cubensis]KAH9477493.1 hypothetical protein JR316_0009710 [Psilocybe cubensis]